MNILGTELGTAVKFSTQKLQIGQILKVARADFGTISSSVWREPWTLFGTLVSLY